MNKNSIVKILFYAYFACIGNPLYAQEGPFGLHWGESESQIKSRGVALLQSKRDGEFIFYRTEKTPKNISIANTYSLVIHEKYGLQKASFYSKDINNDVSGVDGKKIYNQFKQAVIEKYGPTKDSFEYVGRKVYKDYDEFYQCLRYDGCGAWFAFWNLDDKGAISIELKGLGRGNGFLVLNYEGPSWSSAVDESKDRRSIKDKNAL